LGGRFSIIFFAQTLGPHITLANDYSISLWLVAGFRVAARFPKTFWLWAINNRANRNN
jgi:hypothetical protein